MKKSILLGLGAVAMAMGVGAGLAINGFEAPVEAAAETTIVPQAGKVYFNVSAFGPTYNDGANFATFSVSVGEPGEGSSWVNQHWADVTVEDAEYGLISVTVTANETRFIVVRSDAEHANKWQDQGAWNQTATFNRSSGQNYGWIYSQGENQYGNMCSWHTVSGASLKVNGSAQQTFKYDFKGNEQYVLTEVALHEGDKVFITYGGTDYGYSSLQHNAQGDCRGWFGEGASNEIEILADGNYEFYWKQGSSLIWAQVSSDIEAAAWARTFLDATVCTNSGLVDPTFKGQNPDGNDWTWELLGTAYSELTNGAKNYLYAGGATMEEGSNKAAVIEAVARYDWIRRNHGTTFGKFITNGSGEYRAGLVSPALVQMNSAGGMAISLSLLAFLGIGAAATLIFFARKHKDI